MQAPTRRQFLNGGGVAAIMAGGAGLPLTSAAPAGAQDAGTTFDGFVNDRGGQVFNVTNPAYGVKGDTVRALGGITSVGSTTFTQVTTADQTSTRAPVAFDPETDTGKIITIQGAGEGGTVLSTRIESVDSANAVTMADAAATAVRGAEFSFGSDDTQAIGAAIDAAGDTGTVYFPPGIYTILGPIIYQGRGGIMGRGGSYVPNAGTGWRNANTIFLSADASAGLVLSGSARYEGFQCVGNYIGTTPLQIGTVANNTVVEAPHNATFIDIWAFRSAGTGWTILGAKDCSFMECCSFDNELDGFYIDGGASGLDFFHAEISWDKRYAIHSDQLVAGASGAVEPNSHVRFYSGLCDGLGNLGAPCVSKVYLRGAIDWRFPEMIMVGSNLGPTVDVDQSTCHDLDFSDCRIMGGGEGNPKDVCIQISGTPPDDTPRTFIKTGGCHFPQAQRSIRVLDDPKSYRYTAVGGWWDNSSGPVAAEGLPAIDTMFTGRIGTWQTATLLAPWSGTTSYRFSPERLVELRGSAKYSGTGEGPLFQVPLGYRPNGTARRIPVATNTGAAFVTVTPEGDVTASPIDGTTLAANTTVYLDKVRFSVDGTTVAVSSAIWARKGRKSK